MPHPRLRVYFGPDNGLENASPAYPTVAEDRVTVRLGEIADWLVDAVRSGRTWLRDFEDDELTISTDLHDIILAYQKYRRPSA